MFLGPAACAVARSSMSARGSLVLWGALAAFVAGIGCSNCGGTPAPHVPADGGDPSAPKATRAEFELVAFGRVLGTIAPCGCTTEPLGGLQYVFGWLQANTPAQSRLVLEPGSFLYPDPHGPNAPTDAAGWEQAQARADLLSRTFAALGDALVSGYGPTDAASPAGASAELVRSRPKVACNVAAKDGVAIARGRVVELQDEGVTWKVGVTMVLDPSLPDVAAMGTVTPAAPAVREALAELREQGAQTTVVMAHGDRKFAEGLVREVEGIDVAVVGVIQGVERARTGFPAARLGKTWVLEPGDQMQTVSHLRLSIDASGKVVPGTDAWEVVPARAELERELARIEERLAKFASDPSADKAFVARLEDERERVKASMDQPVTAAAAALFEQVKVTCKLPSDPAASEALAAYDHGVAEANRKRFTGVKPPPPGKGEAGYVGVDGCADCHEDAVAFWKTTVHASAWQTLVDGKKDLDLSCVSCHVTGWRKPGGSELVENAGLRDVQCEVCHGPGSLHVDDGGDDLKRIVLATPEKLCRGECHTPEHSDTFDYVPYLRDILGPGHGADARAKLGDGPTGAELRKAGLAKAGGPCKKM